MAQNYIQQADQLKTAPDAWLSKELKNPSGSFPGFLVAAEAAKRASTRSREAVPQKGTVAQSLGSRLDSMRQELPAAGQMQAPPQTAMPPMGSALPAQQGLGALSTPGTQGYEGGGKVDSKTKPDPNWQVKLRDGAKPTFDFSDYRKQLFQEESHGGKNEWNDNHVYGGPYQMNMSRGIDPKTGKFKQGTYNYYAEKMGLPLSDGKELPPVEAQEKVYTRGYYPDLLNTLHKEGVDLSQSNVYMGHKYGAGAVPTLLKNWQQDPNQGWTETLDQIYGKKLGEKVGDQNVLSNPDRDTLGKEIFRLRQNFGDVARNPDEFYAAAGQEEPIGGFGNESIDLNQNPHIDRQRERLLAMNYENNRMAQERTEQTKDQKNWNEGMRLANMGANIATNGIGALGGMAKDYAYNKVSQVGDVLGSLGNGIGYLYNEATRKPTPEEAEAAYRRSLIEIPLKAELRDEIGPRGPSGQFNHGGMVHLDSGTTPEKRKNMNPILLGEGNPIVHPMDASRYADDAITSTLRSGGTNDEIAAWQAAASPEDNALLYEKPVQKTEPVYKPLRPNIHKYTPEEEAANIRRGYYNMKDVFNHASDDLSYIWDDSEHSKFTGKPVRNVVGAGGELLGRGFASLVPIAGMVGSGLGMGLSGAANYLIGDANNWEDPRPKHVPKWMINIGDGAKPSDYEDGMPRVPGYDVNAPIDISEEDVAAATLKDPVLLKAAEDKAAAASGAGGGSGAGDFNIDDLASIKNKLDKLNPEGARNRAYAESVDRIFGSDAIAEMKNQNAATALMQAAGAMMQPGTFGQNLGRAFTTGSGAYAQGNNELRKFQMEQLGGLGDLAKLETDRGDKSLAGAVDIYTAMLRKQAALAGRSGRAGSIPNEATLYPETMTIALDLARQKAGIPKEGDVGPTSIAWMKMTPAQQAAARELQMQYLPDILDQLTQQAFGHRIYKSQKDTADASQ